MFPTLNFFIYEIVMSSLSRITVEMNGNTAVLFTAHGTCIVTFSHHYLLRRLIKYFVRKWLAFLLENPSQERYYMLQY